MATNDTLRLIFGGNNWKRRTSPYGWRTHPITGKRTFHYGTDYSCNKVNLYAIESGTVYRRGYEAGGAGNYIYVYYPRLGLCIAYFHLSSISVAAGRTVSKGTKIGVAGTTGASTGVHLHIGVRNKATWKWQNADTWLANYKTGSSTGSSGGGTVNVTLNILRKGSKGEQVKTIQRILYCLGYYKGKIDGLFGAQTDAALRAYQKAYGLVVDGLCGTKTWTSLLK